MKRWWAILLLPCALAAQQQPAGPATPPSLTISLPRDINPEAVLIECGFSGSGLSLRHLPTRAGVREYAVGWPDPEIGTPVSLKLLIYVPGYRMVTEEIPANELQTGKVFVPALVSLPTTMVRGRLIDTAGLPIGNEALKVDYALTEQMGYFGYADGMVSSFRVANIVTDANGEFAFAVPDLLDDPFFVKYATQGQFAPRGMFQISGAAERGYMDPTLAPGSFLAQKTYAPLTILKTRKGTLTGRLGSEYLRQNNLSDDLLAYVRPRDSIVTGIQLLAKTAQSFFNATLYPDGRYELQVPAGKYDISLWVNAENRGIPIEANVVIEEGKQRVLDRP